MTRDKFLTKGVLLPLSNTILYYSAVVLNNLNIEDALLFLLFFLNNKLRKFTNSLLCFIFPNNCFFSIAILEAWKSLLCRKDLTLKTLLLLLLLNFLQTPKLQQLKESELPDVFNVKYHGGNDTVYNLLLNDADGNRSIKIVYKKRWF